jgi:phosphatidylserine decarboxylase precursor
MFGLQKGWYEDASNWHSFNDFFSRKLSSPDARPIASPEDESIVASGADSQPQGVWNIDNDGNLVQHEGVVIKSRQFNAVDDLLGPESAYRGQFNGGTLTHTFLDVNDYHRYHFPVGGTVKSMYIIPHDDSVGGIVYWSDKLKRYVLESNSLSWQAYETRGCAIVETDEYGLVAVLPIGMGQVSSVNWEPTLKVGQKVEKGAPLGYFLFGGSDCVLLFQKQAGFKHTAPRGGEGSYSNGYAHIYQGEQLGTIGK